MAVEVTRPGTTDQRNGAAAQSWVYMAEDAPATNRDLLGGKGAGLAAMTQAGLPVPAAFTITTAACNAYQGADGVPRGPWAQATGALPKIGAKAGPPRGAAPTPLLGWARAGAH